MGRAPGGSSLSSSALGSPGHPEHHDNFPRQAAELCAFLRDGFPTDHQFAHLKCLPAPNALRSLWMLGSGGGSAGLAGALGMGLALARFIAPRTCSPTIFDHHAQVLRQSGRSATPARLLAMAVICAETDQQARHIAGTAAYRKMMTSRGSREPLLPPEVVAERVTAMNAADRELFNATLDDMVVGSPEHCRREINELALQFSSRST
ncbi:LLM class flavin-dependent oxidoreductase [Pseudomonas helleri]|uniref:LLM class flavin-dependent oxidoreductase n=1 Tax=Pseudomonas helleri TaxID=1608996 RepID=UPI003F99D623